MPGFIIGNEGNIKDIYLTEYELLDSYVQGNLWLWGRNTMGQLGDNSRTHRSSPIQTVSGGSNWKQASSGISHAAAIKFDGTLWLWGNNDAGKLGNNSTTRVSSPIQTVAGGTDWNQVTANWDNTAAIKTDGTLWLWGLNTNGQLGTDDITHRSSPVQTVAGGTDWKQVSCGSEFVSAIKNNGTLWVWGRNNLGQLGTDNRTSYSSPVQTISAGSNWKQVSAGNEHTGAIKSDRTLWMWGRNTHGQLGTNDRTSYSSPVQTVAGGSDWKLINSGSTPNITAGSGYTAGIKTDGSLWLWGINTNGQLGTNDIVHRSSPVQTISNGDTWKEVSCGEFTSSIRYS